MPTTTKGRRKTTSRPSKKRGRAATPRRPSEPRPVHPRVRDPITDDEIAAAKDHEQRGLVCLRILAEGWDVNVGRLLRIWGVPEPTLAGYRRSGKVALAAIANTDAAKRLEEVTADLQVQADEHERLAAHYRTTNRPTLATKHDDLRRRAMQLLLEVSGLMQRRVVHSLEADPRVAGMYQAILGALEDRDRQEADREQRLGAWLADVERLTGGVLPEGRPDALPSVREHVRDAVKRYEVELGARTEARRIAA